VRIATFSFDDGGAGDLDVIQILKDLGVPTATFYLCGGHLVPSFYDGMHRDEIRDMYSGFEVGNHTLTHKQLPKLTYDAAFKEISGGKAELRGFFRNRNIQCFAYPAGMDSPVSRTIVASLGMKFARTCRRSKPEAVATCNDPMLMPITCAVREHALPEKFRVAIAAGLPVHVLSHGWEVRVKGIGNTIREAITALKSAGYTFMDNYGFFKETLA